MIHFPVLRTRRLTVQLRELSIGDSLALASLPLHLEQAAITAFLRAACGPVASEGLTDPVHWTVQERLLGVCHYLAAVLDDGPDFQVGEGRYSDYLDGAVDIPLPVERLELGELGGDVWQIRHLTGWAAEAIERMAGEVDGFRGYAHWLLGGMAAQLVCAKEDCPDAFGDEWLVERMRILRSFPESDFLALVALYQSGRERLHHLFRFDFDDRGIRALPRPEAGGAATLPPARFPVRSGLSEFARRLGGQPSTAGP